MNYDNYHFLGMHLFWWFVWGIVLIWIFIIPYDIPGQRNKKNAPIDILKKRYAAGQISKEEFEEMKKNLEN
ncbi:MAG: SHOCT domain-containing protein [Bacteroidota bacterium]